MNGGYMHKNHTFINNPKKTKKMLSDISNIIIEDEFIVIITTDGDKHTMAR